MEFTKEWEMAVDNNYAVEIIDKDNSPVLDFCSSAEGSRTGKKNPRRDRRG